MSKLCAARVSLSVFFSIAIFVSASADQTLTTFLPRAHLAQFIAQDFDIRTIRSSLNPRRTISQTHFIDLGLRPTQVSEDEIVFDEPDWLYVIAVIARGDVNEDGIEDAIICFTDKAKQGNYHIVTPLLLTKYSKTTPLIAIDYDLSDIKSCNRYPSSDN